MKRSGVLLFSVLILIALGGAVSGEAAPSIANGTVTNVIFCKMIKSGNSYTFEPLPTLYTGENDFGKLTFITGSAKLDNGMYAIIQLTPDGIQLINSYNIKPHGNTTGILPFIRLTISKDQLPVPLAAITDSNAQTPAARTPAAAAQSIAGTNTAPAHSSSAVPQATTPAKSPVSLPVILAGAGIGGILCFARIRK